MEVREVQLLNIWDMSVTLLVSQLERFPMEVKERFQNILFMLVTLLVFRVTWQLTKKVLAMLAGLFLISLAGLAVFAVYSGVTSLVGMLL